jgi:hypothetical protein
MHFDKLSFGALRIGGYSDATAKVAKWATFRLTRPISLAI